MWSGWTEFTECRGKACGISRYKWRRRQCLNETIDIEKPDAAAYLENSNPCFGISEEVMPHKYLSLFLMTMLDVFDTSLNLIPFLSIFVNQRIEGINYYHSE